MFSSQGGGSGATQQLSLVTTVGNWIGFLGSFTGSLALKLRAVYCLQGRLGLHCNHARSPQDAVGNGAGIVSVAALQALQRFTLAPVGGGARLLRGFFDRAAAAALGRLVQNLPPQPARPARPVPRGGDRPRRATHAPAGQRGRTHQPKLRRDFGADEPRRAVPQRHFGVGPHLGQQQLFHLLATRARGHFRRAQDARLLAQARGGGAARGDGRPRHRHRTRRRAGQYPRSTNSRSSSRRNFTRST